MKQPNPTATKILDLAEIYTQTKGFNAFSYRDIQNQIGVKTSTIHYYFPTKSDLAYKVTERCLEQFRQMLTSTAKKQHCGLKRIEALADFYVKTFKQGKSCLFMMMSIENRSLPKSVSYLVEDFFKHNQDWITDSVELGIRQGTVKQTIEPEDFGAQFLAILHGGMIITPNGKSSIASIKQLFLKSIDQIRL